MKIKGFEKVFYINEFELKKAKNRHSICKFKASIQDGEIDRYLNLVGKQVTIQLENDIPIFVGIIQEIDVEKTYSSISLNVSLISLSSLIDNVKKSRVFQDPKKKINDILSAKRLALKKCELHLADKVKNIEYKRVIVQNQETDFDFICRIARYINTDVWIIDTIENQFEFYIDEQVSDRVNKIEEKEIIEYKIKKSNYNYKFELVLDKYLELGRMVQIGKSVQKYIIEQVVVRQVHNTNKYIYVLNLLENKRKEQTDAVHLEKTLKLKAKVTNIKDPENKGRIQVEFIEKNVEDMDKNLMKKTWLSYNSPYSGKQSGIVFLPDIDDIVEVIFTNEECYVGSTLRNKSLLTECQNVEEKYIGNNYNQRIFWKKDSLELFSFENKIVMNKDKIEISVGNNKLIMNKDLIVLQTEENQVLLGKDGLINKSKKDIDLQGKNIKFGSDDKIQFDSKGKFNIKGNSDINVNSNKTLSLNGDKVNIC